MAYPVSDNWPGVASNAGPDYIKLFKVAYADMIRLKTQVMESALSDTLSRETLKGDPLELDSYKAVSLTTRSRGQRFGNVTGGSGATAHNEQKYSEMDNERRSLVPEFWEYAELFDNRDSTALLRAVRPDSTYAASVAAAFNRKKDEVILNAILGGATIDGTALTGNTGMTSNIERFRKDTNLANGGTGTLTSAESTLNAVAGTIGEAYSSTTTEGGGAQVVVRNITTLAGGTASGVGAGMHIKKLLIALEVLGSNGVDPGVRKFCAIHPTQVGQLLSELEYTSADYNAARPLMSGQPASILGIEFRVCPTIESSTSVIDAATTGSPGVVTTSAGRYAVVYTEDAGVFGLTNDMTVRFDELPERGYALQCYHEFGLGSIRMDPKRVVAIPCDN